MEDSPFFTGEEINANVLDNSSKLVTGDVHNANMLSQPSKEKIIDKLRLMFPDRITHMKILIDLYKKCFTTKAKSLPNYEKSIDDVISDVMNTKINLDLSKDIQDNVSELINQEYDKTFFSKRVQSIPVFLDFAFIYYVWNYDKHAPIHKLPSIIKFNMIIDAISAPKDILYTSFKTCIENKHISEMRIEIPPYMLRTELSYKEVKKIVDEEIKPIFKTIINELLKMEKSSMVITNIKTGEQTNPLLNSTNDIDVDTILNNKHTIEPRPDNIVAQTADEQAVDGQAVDGQTADGQAVDEQVDEQTADGQAVDEWVDEQTADGPATALETPTLETDEQTADGQTADGQTADERVDGQATV